MPKIVVTQIELIRAEGPVGLCGVKFVLAPGKKSIWEQANDRLFEWSRTAPRKGGYDKCDFRITYADGETYDGRYDLKHFLCEKPDLAEHVQCHVKFIAGLYRPAWMNDEHWQASLDNHREDRPAYLEFYQKYDIGEATNAISLVS